MILKVCRKKIIETNNEGSIETVTEFYNGKSFKQINGNVTIDDKQSVIINNYSQLDEITGNFINYETVYAFIMNDDGKTIERVY